MLSSYFWHRQTHDQIWSFKFFDSSINAMTLYLYINSLVHDRQQKLSTKMTASLYAHTSYWLCFHQDLLRTHQSYFLNHSNKPSTRFQYHFLNFIQSTATNWQNWGFHLTSLSKRMLLAFTSIANIISFIMFANITI